jgi:hypothetical protein
MNQNSFKKYLYKTRSIILFLLLGLFVGANTEQAEDLEIWTFVGAETQWKNVEFSLTNANFFATEGGWFLNFTQVGFDFISERAISFGVAYKQEYVQFPNVMRTEYRPMLHGYYTKELGNFELSDRNRLEFRIIDGKMFNRYRNRIQLEYNVRDKLFPYVSTAVFFYFDEFRYSRQRTALGVVVPIKSLALNVFGVHQVDRLSPELDIETWYNRFILGTSLSYSF